MTISPFHPGPAALQRFADGEANPREQKRVASHLIGCDECRVSVGGIRNVGTQARMLPSPEASPELLDRILKDRASGDRVILPQSDDHAPRRLADRRLVAGLALVVGAAGYFAWTNRSNPVLPNVAGHATSAVRDSLDLPVSTPGMFLSRLLLPPTAGALAPSVVPPLTGIDGRRLKAGQYFFSSLDVTSSGVSGRTTGKGILRVSASTDGEGPTWNLDYQWTREPGSDGVRFEVESLAVRQKDLRPVTRSVHVSPYLGYSRLNIVQRFNDDSVSGAMSAEKNNMVTVRRPIAQPLPPQSRPYITEALAPLLFSTVNLREGWAARLSMLGWAVVPRDVRYPVQLRVTGQERVRVPAGDFDCWRLEVTEGTVVHTYWVRKSDGVGVRTRVDRTRSSGAGGNHEIILTREAK